MVPAFSMAVIASATESNGVVLRTLNPPLLAEEPTQARQMLRSLLDGRIAFTPNLEARKCVFEGRGNMDELFRGLIELPQALASPMPASWNQIVSWLRQIDGLRAA